MTAYSPSPDEIDYLSLFLDSPEVPEGSLDFIASHGYLCATTIISDEFDAEQCLFNLLGEPIKFQSNKQKLRLISIIENMVNYLARQLYLGDEIEFPMAFDPADNDDANELTDWCFGFMESVGDYEALWFTTSQDEATIAELILPISILAEPITEPELLHLVNSPQKKQLLADDIIDNLQQLYLEFRS